MIIFPDLLIAETVSPSPSDNTAWLSGWSYRIHITITNQPEELQDYPLQITLDTEALILDEKMKDDMGDLRFALADGTVLPYWIESGINTSSTKVRVRILSIPLQGITIYTYYGNADAVGAENEEAASYDNST